MHGRTSVEAPTEAEAAELVDNAYLFDHDYTCDSFTAEVWEELKDETEPTEKG